MVEPLAEAAECARGKLKSDVSVKPNRIEDDSAKGQDR
jgi:hypothetical protein